MRPAVVLVWSLTMVFATIAARGLSQLALLGILSGALLVFAARALAPVRRALLLSFPVIAMLLLVHGIVGPQFPAEGQILGLAPWRPEGIRYGLDIGARVLIVTLAALMWASVPRDELIDDLVASGAPAPVIGIVGQTAATLWLLRRRVATVYLAQRARGAPVDGNILHRLASMPAVLVPVVVGVLVDAEARACVLESRAYFERRLSPVHPRPLLLADKIAMVLGPLVLGGALAIGL